MTVGTQRGAYEHNPIIPTDACSSRVSRPMLHQLSELLQRTERKARTTCESHSL